MAPSGGKNSQPPVPTLLAKPKNASLIGKKPVNMSENDVKVWIFILLNLKSLLFIFVLSNFTIVVI